MLLYASVFWFINELQQVKLQSNNELSQKELEKESESEKLSANATESSQTTATPEDIKPRREGINPSLLCSLFIGLSNVH